MPANTSVGSPAEPVQGVVAVLDALGAAVYSREEADRFLQARDQVMKLLNETATTASFRIDKSGLMRFIFSDTVVLTYVRREPLNTDDINGFCGLLRTVEAYFLRQRIFFRGALAIGELYRADEQTNTVMGPAISDAAAWYTRADWIGIHTTPQATVFVRSLLCEKPEALDHVLLDYNVPLKDKSRMHLKAVNWPKTLYLTHQKDAVRARATLLGVLGTQPVPAGAESKYFHAIEFFDHCEKTGFSKTAQA
ncbi:MAG: hypothetical protein WBC51_05015 [Vicinamibacterales bacterium]